MALYYFHCTNGRRQIPDQQGYDAADLDDIYRHAIRLARAVMAHSPGADWSDWMVDVYDARENVVAMVSFLTARRPVEPERPSPAHG